MDSDQARHFITSSCNKPSTIEHGLPESLSTLQMKQTAIHLKSNSTIEMQPNIFFKDSSCFKSIRIRHTYVGFINTCFDLFTYVSVFCESATFSLLPYFREK